MDSTGKFNCRVCGATHDSEKEAAVCCRRVSPAYVCRKGETCHRYVVQNGDKRSVRYGEKPAPRAKLPSGLCEAAGMPRRGYHALHRLIGGVWAEKYKFGRKVMQRLLGCGRTATAQDDPGRTSDEGRTGVEKTGLREEIPAGKTRGEKKS